MAIAAVFEFPGEPVEKYHKVFDAGQAIVNQPDRLYHVCYRTDTGFTVIDIWASEQSFAAFGETLGPAIHHAGLDARPAVYPVEQVMAKTAPGPLNPGTLATRGRLIYPCPASGRSGMGLAWPGWDERSRPGYGDAA